MKSADYESMIKAMDWPGLAGLHAAITVRDTVGWEPGKALEYLIPRLFEPDGARVRWPYEIRMGGQVIEQIDGAVEAAGCAD